MGRPESPLISGYFFSGEAAGFIGVFCSEPAFLSSSLAPSLSDVSSRFPVSFFSSAEGDAVGLAVGEAVGVGEAGGTASGFVFWGGSHAPTAMPRASITDIKNVLLIDFYLIF